MHLCPRPEPWWSRWRQDRGKNLRDWAEALVRDRGTAKTETGKKLPWGKAPASRTMSLQQVRAVSCSQGHIIIVVARDIQVKLMNAVDSMLGGWAKLRQLTWAMLLLLGCYCPRLPSLVTWVLYYLSFSKCWSVVLGVSTVWEVKST